MDRRSFLGALPLGAGLALVTQKVAHIPKVLNGLGVAIVSTPRGILTGSGCREKGVGGECEKRCGDRSRQNNHHVVLL